MVVIFSLHFVEVKTSPVGLKLSKNRSVGVPILSHGPNSTRKLLKKFTYIGLDVGNVNFFFNILRDTLYMGDNFS